MGSPRYEVDFEPIRDWVGEEMLKNLTHLNTDSGVRATITDRQTGTSGTGVGADREEALGRACRELGISESDLED